MSMATIGATPAGGNNRLALSDVDGAGRDLFVSWCEAAGCRIRVDSMGNIFARRGGSNPQASPVLIGSHLDTQPTGGRFDGVYGVLAGLEVVRRLNDLDIVTSHPIDVVCWTNEEGVRFAPAMIGSGVWAGEFEEGWAHAITDKEGVTIGQALAQIGYDGAEAAHWFPTRASFEIHIEQGPILEQERKTIGVVTGVQGMRWYDISIHGEPCHAGPTPMAGRRDPFRALSTIIDRIYGLAEEHAPWGRVTFGDVRAEPGSRNTVPALVCLALDIRHPEIDVLSQMDVAVRSIVAEVCSGLDLDAQIADQWNSPPAVFAEELVAEVAAAAQALDLPTMRIISGAGHDSVYVSKVADAAMIFVPCKDGLSHNEAESATPEDLAAGCSVLLGAVLAVAG